MCNFENKNQKQTQCHDRTHTHTDARLMPIVFLSVQDQARKKRNLQTGYIDVE
jgi:hypothetical protein